MIDVNIKEMLKEKEQRLSVLISMSLAMYIKSLKFIIPIALAIFIPINLVISLIPSNYHSLDITSGGVLNTESIGRYISYSLVVGGMNLIFAPVASAAAASIVKHILEKNQITFSSILDDSLFKWWKLSITSIVWTAMIIPLLFFVIPAMYIGIIFYFYVHVIVFTDKWGIPALLHSAAVIKKRFWKTSLFILMIFIANFIYYFVANEIISIFPASNLTIIGAILTSVVQAFGIYFSFLTAIWFCNWDLCRRNIEP